MKDRLYDVLDTAKEGYDRLAWVLWIPTLSLVLVNYLGLGLVFKTTTSTVIDIVGFLFFYGGGRVYRSYKRSKVKQKVYK